MMQATDFWDGDDSSDAAMLNRAGLGAILVEREMRASALVVVAPQNLIRTNSLVVVRG